MSDERYTVILGDRRYAIHRKWARLPAGESFGFLSDLMVDAGGRVHVAQRGTDRPVLVFERDGRECVSCGKRTGIMTCDHVIPVSRGGSSTLDNLVTACERCNLAKGQQTPDEWLR